MQSPLYTPIKCFVLTLTVTWFDCAIDVEARVVSYWLLDFFPKFVISGRMFEVRHE